MDRESAPSERVLAVVSGAPGAERHLQAMCRALASKAPFDLVPKLLASYADLEKEVAAGKAHIAWAPPLVAIELERAGLATIALCCTRGGQTGYHAALFTRHASRIGALTDLKGAHIAWVDPHSSAGYLVPRMRIASAGLDPATLFGRESFLGTHERVAVAVLDGEADAGATYLSLDPTTQKPLSAGWLEAGAGMNGAYILATAGPIPSDAIVLASSIPAADRAALTSALADLPKAVPEAIGGLLRADGFAVPEPAHFEGLRTLSAALPAR